MILAPEYAELQSQIPQDYHDLLGVVSKQMRTTLPPRCPHDHHIDLMYHTPPYGPMYSFSEVEQLALREFLDESSSILYWSTRPFVKKKDGSLRLAVDDGGLNKITKKDRYTFPLIPDIFDRLRSDRAFSKLCRRGTYNLVRRQ